jgi:hypothetical protein
VATIAPPVATTPTIPNIPDPLPVLGDILGSVNKLIDEFVRWAQTAPYRLIDAGTPPAVATIAPMIDIPIQPDTATPREQQFAPLFGGINLDPLSDAIRAGAIEISSPSVTVFETQAPAPIIDGGDLHVRVDLDGYQAGEAIVRQWRRRTGGGMSI